MNKKQIALNSHIILCGLLFCALLGMAAVCAAANEIGLCVGFSLLLLVPVFAFLVSPRYFVFSDDCVEIVYHFGIKEQIRWKDIQRVSLMGSWFNRFSAAPHYVIAYNCREKRPFFVAGRIPKTRKTKNLMKMYCKKEIQKFR